MMQLRQAWVCSEMTHKLGITGGESRGHLINPGLSGRWAIKQCMCVPSPINEITYKDLCR